MLIKFRIVNLVFLFVLLSWVPLYAQTSSKNGSSPGAAVPSAGGAPAASATKPATISPSASATQNPGTTDETALILGEPTANGTVAPATSSVWVVIKMVLVLALVAAAVYGVVFVLKKVARPTEKKDPFLRVLATASVGSNRFVHVVALGSKAYLVGSGDAGVNLIAEVDDKETLDAMLLDESQRDAEGRGPGTLDFKTILRRFSPPSSGTPNAQASVEKLRKRRERIQGL